MVSIDPYPHTKHVWIKLEGFKFQQPNILIMGFILFISSYYMLLHIMDGKESA